MTDSYTDDLFNLSNIKKIVFPISRLICDVERFRNEKDEIMTKQGMWVTYSKTSDLKSLKVLTKKHKEEILEKYYDKHHQNFYREVKSILDKYGKCLIIDCHSFSSTPLPYELNQEHNRPDICIGIDSFHTSRELAEKLKELFINFGYSVSVNNPFSGTIVPLEYYGVNKKVQSIMIEVNRKLYMNEINADKTKNYKKLKQNLRLIIKEIIQYF